MFLILLQQVRDIDRSRPNPESLLLSMVLMMTATTISDGGMDRMDHENNDDYDDDGDNDDGGDADGKDDDGDDRERRRLRRPFEGLELRS